MLKRVLFPTLVFLVFTVFVFGQDGSPNRGQRFDGRPPANDERPDLLTQLGLVKEQIRQFRRANAEHRPLMQAAQQKMREANRELDMAIYADTVSEEVVNAKLRAFQDAQNEVNRLRFMNELSIRNILTPEQLVRFREMRRRFAETRDRLLKPRGLPQNGGEPADQFRQQPKPPGNDQPVRQMNRQNRPIN